MKTRITFLFFILLNNFIVDCHSMEKENTLTNDNQTIPIGFKKGALYEVVKDFKAPRLDLKSQDINDDNATDISLALKSNDHIKELDLSNNSITNLGLDKLCKSIEDNTILTSLDIRNNKMYGYGIETLTKLLRSNTTLTSLSMSINYSVYDDTILQAGLLTNHPPHQSGVTQIVSIIQQNTSLKTLRVENSAIGDSGVDKILISLNNNNSITELSLKSNRTGDLSGEKLSTILGKNIIKVLNLRDNLMSNHGLFNMCIGLGNNNSLTSLDLSQTSIDQECLKNLALVLIKTNIKYLFLENNNIGEDIGEFVQAINKSQLQKVLLSKNKIREGAREFVKILPLSDLQLKDLDLRENGISVLMKTLLNQANPNNQINLRL